MGAHKNHDNAPTFSVNGEAVPFRPGEPVATALLSAGYRHLRDSPGAGAPRGAFCFMGVCQECVAHIDGELRQTCLVPAAAGMRVVLGSQS